MYIIPLICLWKPQQTDQFEENLFNLMNDFKGAVPIIFYLKIDLEGGGHFWRKIMKRNWFVLKWNRVNFDLKNIYFRI